MATINTLEPENLNKFESLTDLFAAIQREVDERFVLRPVDADGEVIRVGDVVTVNGSSDRFVVDSMKLIRGGRGEKWCIGLDIACRWHRPSELRHYHKPTVKDVLLDFVIALDKRGHLSNGVALTIDEFSPKLRIVDDGED